MNKLKRLIKAILVFKNFWIFITLYFGKSKDTNTLLHTRSGLAIRVRNNRWDARIIAEMYLDRCYPNMFATLPANPVIIDIGGYIGDFALYAAHEFGARVIVYEPTLENYALLMENVNRNNLGEQITCHNAGVGGENGRLTLNVTRHDGALHVSGFLYAGATEQITVQAVTIDSVIYDNSLTHIDLLKIDCEGGEYDIISSLDDKHFEKIDRIVFEYHPISEYLEKLKTVKNHLAKAGYRITENRSSQLIAATKV